MTTLICPVRPGDSNEELRYAIRSWESNLILPGGLNLMVVGHCPDWLDPDLFISGNKYASAPLAVFDNVRLGAEAAGEDDALVMNDDFFCLDPVGAVLPVRRNVSLAQHIALFPVNGGGWWPHSLRLTAAWLSRRGIANPDSYEVHRPMPVSPSRLYETLSDWDGGMDGAVPQWRTMYGALNRVEAHPVADAKLGSSATGYGTPWVSTSDHSWRRFAPGITPRFQKPSRWER